MICSRSEECTPVPEHVSVDNSHESSSTPSLSPVTLESSPTAKKHLFREEMTEESEIEIQCRIALEEDESDAKALESKANDIISCLGGVPVAALGTARTSSSKRGSGSEPDRVVDLWHLRQLALTRGGLLNARIRKQAWLKLVDANRDVLMSPLTLDSIQAENRSSGEPHKALTLSDHEIKMIKTDIKRCIWNIEAEMKRSKITQRMAGKARNVSTGDVTSLASFESASGQQSLGLPPEGVGTFPSCDDSYTNASQVTPTLSVSTPKSGTATPQFSKRKREERSLLLNIITSVLRANPEEVQDLDMERFFYFPGMHNVVAPILITLESPSLTALVLKRLSQYHLKDSMVSTFVDIQSTIRVIFMPLLELVDKPLCNVITQSHVNDPCSFALRWVLCWFTSDIPDYDIVARLFDVFLVSHYTLPIYLSVAILTNASNRVRIRAAAQNESIYLPDLLSGLPSKMVANQSHREVVDSFELVIQTSLSYMQQYPPSQILHLAQSSSDELVTSSIIELNKCNNTRYRPEWTYKSTTSTDWDLIQEAKKTRDLSPNSRALNHKLRDAKFNALENTCFSGTENPLALGASSADDYVKDLILDRHQSKIYRLAIILFCFVALTCWTFVELNHNVQVQNVAPTTLMRNKLEMKKNAKQSENRFLMIARRRTPGDYKELPISKINDMAKHTQKAKAIEMVKAIGNVEIPVPQIEYTHEFQNATMSLDIDTSLRKSSARAIASAKEYVKEDPDLFIIMI